MYRVVLEFNMNLEKTELEAICLQTDEIFANEDILCEESDDGRRVYCSSEENQAFGRMWAAIFELKDTPCILHNLTNGIWENGEKKENLMSDFFTK